MCLMHYVQWPQELDAQLEIPTDGAEGGTPKSKIRRNEKTGVWSHQEGNDEYLNPLGSNFSSMILEESMLEGATTPAAGAASAKGATKQEGSEATNPALNNMYRLHGNVPQRVRQEVYKKFCKAKSGILVSAGVCTVVHYHHYYFHFHFHYHYHYYHYYHYYHHHHHHHHHHHIHLLDVFSFARMWPREVWTYPRSTGLCSTTLPARPQTTCIASAALPVGVKEAIR